MIERQPDIATAGGALNRFAGDHGRLPAGATVPPSRA